jgi:hypothetical protein
MLSPFDARPPRAGVRCTPEVRIKGTAYPVNPVVVPEGEWRTNDHPTASSLLGSG